MKGIGDTVKIYGMDHVITSVSIKPFEKPRVYLIRTCDNSRWYAETTHINRFTHIHRIEDKAHASLDKNDVMVRLDEVFRRI